ncbi:MAG: restriction endonuclease subunit S [Nitrosotalea sp.]
MQKDWKVLPLKKIVNITKTRGTSDQIPYLEIGDVDLETKDYSIKDKPSLAGCLVAKKNQILISKVRPTRGAITRIKENTISVSSAFLILDSNDPRLIKNDYIFHYLRNNSSFLTYLERRQKGSSYPSCRDEDILDFEIPIPTLDVQNKIILILDSIIEAKTKRQKILSLTHSLAKTYFLDIFGDPYDNPKGWETKLLGSILRERISHGKSLERKNVSLEPPGFPVLKLSALTDDVLNSSQFKYYRDSKENLKPWFLIKDDILISRSNTIDLVGRIGRYVGEPNHCIASDLMIRVRPDTNIIEPPYLEFYLQTPFVKKFFQRRARGTSGSMPKISNKDVLDVDVRIPPRDIQQKFVIFNEKTIHLRNKVTQSINLINALLDSIRNQAFNGSLFK